MPDKAHYTPKGAAFAADRLREVLVSMRDIWSKSFEEIQPDGCIDLYVVDADVVQMFMAPLTTHNYGALLRYEGHARKDAGSSLMEVEARLVEFLGNLIFFQLRPAIPLILLPDHAEDLERVLNNVWIKASKELGKWEHIQAAITESANNVIETSKNQLASAVQTVAEKGEKTHVVEELLDEIYRSLRGEGAIGELFRFDELMSGGRLCHLDQMAFQDEHGETRYLPPPLTESGKYIPSVSRLADRLKREMSSRLNLAENSSRTFWIQRDAQAFSHLAWLNELFREEQWFVRMGDGTTRQIRQAVLISGSHLLPQAIDELELKPLRGCITTPLSFLGHRSMDEYFRRSSDNQCIRMNEANQGSQVSALINFFDSMRAVLDSAIQTRNSNEISQAVKDVRSQHYKLTERWQNRQLFGEHSRMESVSAAITSLEESGKSLERLKDFLEELSVDAWQRFARSVTKLSLKSVTNDNAVLRNIPPVRFMRFDVAKEISGNLYRTGDNAKAREIADAILDKSTIQKLKQEDSNHYTEFVCYALFGLVHRALRSAEGCAEVAWSIAQTNPTKGKLAKYIQGDEALYLLAHIIRLRARRSEHMKRAEECINIALNVSRKTSEVDHIDHVDDIRYLAERFSIRCHQLYFECFGPVGSRDILLPIKRDPMNLKLVYSEGSTLLSKINTINPENEGRYLFEYVKQQLLVNLAQIGLLLLYSSKRIGAERIEVYYAFDLGTKILTNEEFSKFKNITQQLILQCEILDNDKTETLPRPSLLATSVAATSSSVFLNKHDLDKWFRYGKVAAIDGLRFKYLESVFNYSRKLNDCDRG